jgi:hypothetical protein
MIRRVLLRSVLVLVVLLVLIQLVPYRVSNPPVTAEPSWDSPRTEELARRACFDCHSNEVVVPWYGYVAPVAWSVRRHVDEGRGEMNLSEMDRPQEEAHEAGEEVAEGEMPPGYYRLMHRSARLSDAERRELSTGLDATLGGEREGHEGREEREGHEEREHH